MTVRMFIPTGAQIYIICIIIAQRQTLAGVLQLLHQHYSEQMTVSIASLAPEQVAILQELIQS